MLRITLLLTLISSVLAQTWMDQLGTGPIVHNNHTVRGSYGPPTDPDWSYTCVPSQLCSYIQNVINHRAFNDVGNKWIWQVSPWQVRCVMGIWLPLAYKDTWADYDCRNEFADMMTQAHAFDPEDSSDFRLGANIVRFPTDPNLTNVKLMQVGAFITLSTGLAINATKPSFVVRGLPNDATAVGSAGVI
ncbi:hypothetical protein MMC09_004382 [Bachmanniomyces sp. S44760]|nr:hypothetical protein [Bachmanniomyces sp. S44760]